MSHSSRYVMSVFAVLAACGQPLERTQPRQPDDDHAADSEAIQLAGAEDLVSANVETFYLTLSVGRDGANGPCRQAVFHIVSDKPLKLKRTYRTEDNQDAMTQLDDHTIRVESHTGNSRDGLVVLVTRGAKLQLQDEVAGQAFSGCAARPDLEPQTMALDLGAFVTDQFAPPRRNSYGRTTPFARMERFYGGRYSLRATFRLGNDPTATLADGE